MSSLIWFNIPWTGSALSAGGAARTLLSKLGSSIGSCCGSWLKAAKLSRNLLLRGGCCYKTCSGTETLFEELRSCLVKVPPPLGPVWLTTIMWEASSAWEGLIIATGRSAWLLQNSRLPLPFLSGYSKQDNPCLLRSLARYFPFALDVAYRFKGSSTIIASTQAARGGF